MSQTLPPSDTRQLPDPWFLARLRRAGETDELMASIDAYIRLELAGCPRCTDIYLQTGLVPVACDVCGALRDGLWMATLEHMAHQHPLQIGSQVQPFKAALAHALPVAR